MGTPAQNTAMRLVPARTRRTGAGRAGPGRVPGPDLHPALQDPVASLRRQVRACQAWLPAGLVRRRVLLGRRIRRHGPGRPQPGRRLPAVHRRRDPPRRRHGRPARRGQGPAARGSPPSSARTSSGPRRDMFNALKLEKELSRQGIPLFATDEPASIEGINATTVLVRRVKQGVAEWYRLQLKEKSWKGLEEHALAGWNIGTAPYGYLAERVPHPAPVKAAQGMTKTRLIPDPVRGPVVTQIYTWRVDRQARRPDHHRPAQRRPGRLPAPDGNAAGPSQPWPRSWPTPSTPGTWSTAAPAPANGRKARPVPPDQWIWSPEPAHPALVDRATWDAAQQIGSRARQRPRPRNTHHPARPPVHPAVPDPVQDLPAPHVRHLPAHHRHRPPPTSTTMPPRPRQPPPRRRPPRPRHRLRPRRRPHDRPRPVLRPVRLRPRPRRPARRPAPRHRRRATPKPRPGKPPTSKPSSTASTPPNAA